MLRSHYQRARFPRGVTANYRATSAILRSRTTCGLLTKKRAMSSGTRSTRFQLGRIATPCVRVSKRPWLTSEPSELLAVALRF